MVKNNQVKSVVITNSEIQIQPVEDKKSLYQVTYYTVNLKDDRMYEMLDQYNVDYTGKNQTTSAWIYQILSFVIPIAIVWILLGAAMKGWAAEAASWVSARAMPRCMWRNLRCYL